MRYYIHGYLSEPNSTKGTLLKEKLGVFPIKYRNVPPEELKISDCVKKIKDQIKNDNEAVLIGSSLGGLLAAKTAVDLPNVRTLILLNPAIIPIDYDLEKIKDMPKRILEEMKDSNLFAKKINSKIFVLIGTQDDVVPNSWPRSFAKAQNAAIMEFEDDHSFSKNLENLPSIITEILNKKG
jgi:predicted esterase YcpF (UPF0227 family)